MLKEMGIHSNLLMWIASAFLAAHIIADVHFTPPKWNPEQIEMIRVNILAQLGMTESPPPLTPDPVKVVKALKEYHEAMEAKRSIDECQGCSQGKSIGWAQVAQNSLEVWKGGSSSYHKVW